MILRFREQHLHLSLDFRLCRRSRRFRLLQHGCGGRVWVCKGELTRPTENSAIFMMTQSRSTSIIWKSFTKSVSSLKHSWFPTMLYFTLFVFLFFVLLFENLLYIIFYSLLRFRFNVLKHFAAVLVLSDTRGKIRTLKHW